MHFTLTALIATSAVWRSSLVHSLVVEPREAGMSMLDGSPGQLSSRENSNSQLQIEIHNGRNIPINAYIGGKNVTSKEPMMLQSKVSAFYHLKDVVVPPGAAPQPVPDSVDLAFSVPAGELRTITLPDWCRSGRIWLAEGDLQFRVAEGGGFAEPSGANPSLPEYNVKWGFVELDNTEGGIVVNLSFVDWVSLSIGMALTSEKGTTEIGGLQGGALQNICNDMKAQSQAKDIGGRPEWEKMCIYSDDGSTLLRVISPNIYASIDHVNNAMADYYAAYVDQVWKKYSNQSLKINTQGNDQGIALSTAGAGVQAICQVRPNGKMTCDKAPGYAYPKPTTQDIWGCASGPFAVGNGNDTAFLMNSRIIPRLCAAFTRTTLLLDGGDVQPFGGQDQYYQNPVTNHYSRIIHKYLDAGKGYSFPYDDVNSNGTQYDAAGVLQAAKPTKLRIDVKGDAA